MESPVAERTVVYTCITGGYDIPLESPWALRCPHICFTDDPHLRSATWTMRLLEGGEDLEPARRSRLPKLLPHRYLSDFDTSVWIDGSARLREDPILLARRALAACDFAAPPHPKRDCAYGEIEVCARLGKETAEALNAQCEAYRAAGLPEHAGLWEATILVRRHLSPELMPVMEDWWREYLAHSRRDQVALGYVAWKHGLQVEPLPSRGAADAPYKLRLHHAHRPTWKRWSIQSKEWLKRARTRLLRALR